MDADGLRDGCGGTGGACNHGGDCGKRHSHGGGGRKCAFDARHHKQPDSDARHHKQPDSHARHCEQRDSHAEDCKQHYGDGCHRQKQDCERRSAGFALLRCKNQGERYGDCQAGGWPCEPRICRLLRHGRSSRRCDRYERSRCECGGKKCDFGFALL